VIPKFSEEFNDLIQKMLQKDPVKRINWEEIKRHPWWQTPIQQAPGS
jgi:serine/threonine protein kinase